MKQETSISPQALFWQPLGLGELSHSIKSAMPTTNPTTCSRRPLSPPLCHFVSLSPAVDVGASDVEDLIGFASAAAVDWLSPVDSDLTQGRVC